MSYIRTKTGIFKAVDLYSDGNYVGVYNKKAILAEADSIEELCDEFVGVDKTCENGHQLLRAIPYKCANFWNGGVYGAIWCKWGLKYVAKMNENGDLELL